MEDHAIERNGVYMRKIVLLCAGGMSTSLLVSKMYDYAETIDYSVEVGAFSVIEAQRVANDADVILIGPQVRFYLDIIKKKLPDKPIDVIDMKAYGMMDGKAVIKHAMKILGD